MSATPATREEVARTLRKMMVAAAILATLQTLPKVASPYKKEQTNG